MTFAGTMDGSGYNRPVRPADADKSRSPEVIDTRTPTQRAADLYYADHLRRLAEKKQQEAREAERQRKKKVLEQAAEDRRRQHDLAEAADTMIDGCFATLSPKERSVAWAILIDSGRVNLENASLIASSVKARRDQEQRERVATEQIAAADRRAAAIRERLREVRERCSDEQWAAVEQPLMDFLVGRYGWTQGRIVELLTNVGIEGGF